MTSDLITTKRDDHIFLVGLNRPEKRNAVNMAMIRMLADAFKEFDEDDSLRVAVVHAAGDHFCGGLELDEVAQSLMSADAPPLHGEDGLDPWGVRTRRATKPLITAVQGYTLTVAIELCMASEIVVAANTAKFAQLEITRGLFAIGGATTRWPLASGYQNAMRYLLTGDFFDAREARRIGLVQDIVAPEELLDYSIAMAKRIAAHAPLGVQATLRTARLMQNRGQREGTNALDAEARRIYATEDAQLGISTFASRTTPVYKGR